MIVKKRLEFLLRQICRTDSFSSFRPKFKVRDCLEVYPQDELRRMAWTPCPKGALQQAKVLRQRLEIQEEKVCMVCSKREECGERARKSESKRMQFSTVPQLMQRFAEDLSENQTSMPKEVVALNLALLNSLIKLSDSLQSQLSQTK